jgi:diguanylate cyclase (GGDEF)-like protein/PAS domain S-box-containing protein
MTTDERTKSLRDETDPLVAELIPHLPAVIYVAAPGASGRWFYVSPKIQELLGYSVEEWCGDPGLWARCLHPDDRERVIAEEEDGAAMGAPVASEYRLVARDGRVIWVRDEAVLRTDSGGSSWYDGLLIDITERKGFESELRFLAEHDELTGLFNRRRFLAELETELRRGRRFQEPVCLMMLDLDGLKLVNDSFGHAAGDSFLRSTAEILAGRLREADTVARLGGDEFGALLRGTTLEQADDLVASLTDRIREHRRGPGGQLGGVGASAGVVQLRPREQGVEDALADADRALYEATRHRPRPPR